MRNHLRFQMARRDRRHKLSHLGVSDSRYAVAADRLLAEVAEAMQGPEGADHTVPGSFPGDTDEDTNAQGAHGALDVLNVPWHELTDPEKETFQRRLWSIYNAYRPSEPNILHYRSHLHAKTKTIQELEKELPLDKWKSNVRVSLSHLLGGRTGTFSGLYIRTSCRPQ